MSTNIVNQSPFLRTSRNFPLDAQPLAVEVNRSYVDIANAVNSRTIGIFPTSRPAQTGENWFLTSQRQSGFREVYSFTDFSSPQSIAHGLVLTQLGSFIRIFGTATDGTSWYPLPYVDAAAANNQIQVVVGTTNIVITAGAGSPPSITSGTVVLEWINQL